MPDYLLLFRGGDSAESGMSPNEMQAHMEKWYAWITEMRSDGIIRGGEPLEKDGRVVHADSTVTDGPFAESKELIGGYVTIESDSLDTAAEVAKGCPVLETGGKVEVRQVAVLTPHHGATPDPNA